MQTIIIDVQEKQVNYQCNIQVSKAHLKPTDSLARTKLTIPYENTRQSPYHTRFPSWSYENNIVCIYDQGIIYCSYCIAVMRFMKFISFPDTASHGSIQQQAIWGIPYQINRFQRSLQFNLLNRSPVLWKQKNIIHHILHFITSR